MSYEASLSEHLSLFATLHRLQPEVERAAKLIADSMAKGGKLLLCGNGGSAADCQHIAAEFTGRFLSDRDALPAIALTTDTSALTAIANDYGYWVVFARQVQALGRPGDVLLCISTSGESESVWLAAQAAAANDMSAIALTGHEGGKLAQECDISIIVPCNTTARIQEAHGFIGHMLCELVEEGLA